MFIQSSAGPHGEAGRPPVWGGLRESEESLPQTVAVSGDGEEVHVLCMSNKEQFSPLGPEHWLTNKCFYR